MNVWLYNYPRVVDNYGLQVVTVGEKCPFCGMSDEQARKIVDEYVVYGNDCPTGRCEF